MLSPKNRDTKLSGTVLKTRSRVFLYIKVEYGLGYFKERNYTILNVYFFFFFVNVVNALFFNYLA